MMRKVSSILLFLTVISLLLFAVFKEQHRVHSLDDDTAKDINGYVFTEAATVDGLMLDTGTGRLQDVYSLTPEFLQEKDCPT